MKMEENHLLLEIYFLTYSEESSRNIYSTLLYGDSENNKQRRDSKDMYSIHAVVILDYE